MSRFIQLHMLTSYPPSNPNRDDLGRPKTAIMGGTQRMRISSQSLKRAWRTSEIFEDALVGFKGVRTKEMGVQIRKAILSGKPLAEHLKDPDMKIIMPEDKKIYTETSERAFQIARVFVDKIGKNSDEEQDSEEEPTEDVEQDKPEDDNVTEKKKGNKSQKNGVKKSNIDKNTLKSEQIVFYTPEDIDNIQILINNHAAPSEDDLKSLISAECSGADVAMFGRMLANAPGKNIEAAVQVAHAITVHTVAIEDDYFTAVDDLNRGKVDAGSAFLSEAEFSAGLFYSYICINKDLLIKNLNGRKDISEMTIAALIETASKIAPSGKQNSFANRVRTSYILAEKGDDQPRSLSVAYLKPVHSNDFQKEAIENLLLTVFEMDKAYGDSNTQRKAFISNRTEIVRKIDQNDKLKPFETELKKIEHDTLSNLISFAKE